MFQGSTMAEPNSRITEILSRIDLGDVEQAEELLALIYDDLRVLAARHLRRERPGHTLQPTDLVHEAYLRLAGSQPIDWTGRSHFFRVAARAMRQVLVDAARRRQAAKRGGGEGAVTVAFGPIDDAPDPCAVLDLHDALERLGDLDESMERLVELRFFTGLTMDETASALGVSPRKAAKDWAAARLWLRRELVGA
jgi:RNA polymerase sigma factor (TIGR02999 family)